MSQAAVANPDSDVPVAAPSDVPQALPGSEALTLLRQLPDWGTVVTIVLHGGSVFEFKGPFPQGEEGRGFYNLDGPVPGFHGHLNLAAIDYIGFQEKPHAGRPAYALTFNNFRKGNIFKVFLGRDSDGEIWPEQLRRFEALKQSAIPLPTIKEQSA
jgi:putative heme utilization carrier protein HutX